MLELTMNDILYMIKGALTGQIGEIQIYAKSKCDISFVYTFYRNTLIIEMEDNSKEVGETITVSCIELSDVYIPYLLDKDILDLIPLVANNNMKYSLQHAPSYFPQDFYIYVG